MNATPTAMQSASCSAPVVDAPAKTISQHEQREKNKSSFKAKYDAMLYIVEFIASFHLLDRRSPKQAKEMEDVKSLVAQTRNGLGVCQTAKR